tara:strand:+ start:218 stop:481 length:264 start_codon:yes stop_codon:yes gene_type:complete
MKRRNTKYWDSEIFNIWTLVTTKGYRSKELAKHYDVKENSFFAMLYRREISIVRWRSEASKGIGFTWSRANMLNLDSIGFHVKRKAK